MKAAWQAHLNAGESMMAELAFEIAETIVGAPLPDPALGEVKLPDADLSIELFEMSFSLPRRWPSISRSTWRR